MTIALGVGESLVSVPVDADGLRAVLAVAVRTDG